ncbi:MAG: transcription-repair coupling factor [Alphaproteobacteria bacterium]|nr:transcription-repair coupling factor [Alphaproteobacteria bacterium]
MAAGGFPGRLGVHAMAGAPEGWDAKLLGELARTAPAGLVHVARDGARLRATRAGIGFFAPDLRIIELPAWDCVPYDRASPNAEIEAQRMRALTQLVEGEGGPGGIVLTTVNAFLQRLPPRESLAGAVLRLAAGQQLDLKAMQDYLVRNGYQRTGTVLEAGEFALRGGIVDIYPPGAAAPARLDLFGNQLESIRRFDALSQRTIDRTPELRLSPVSEVPLSKPAIERFRNGYRQQFGAVLDEDPLYQAVSEGRRHIGMEHWLPLFHERMDTLLDYLPGAALAFDHRVAEVAQARLTEIAEHYETRRVAAAAKPAAYAEQAPYKPLPPSLLYVERAEFAQLPDSRAVLQLNPFQVPPGEAAIDAGGRVGRDFAAERAQPEINVFDALIRHVAERQKAGRRVLVAAYSAGAADRLMTVLADHGAPAVQAVADWLAAEALARSTVGVAVLPLEHGFETDALALIGEQDILGDRLVGPRRRSRRAENFLTEARQLSQGDYVVHVEHGIGRYQGLTTIEVGGAPHDCLLLLYADNDKLYVPVENIEVLSRYGAEDATVALDKLGGVAWQQRKARLKKRIREMADELIRIAAERAVKPGQVVAVPEGLYEEFCARFPYEETEDQKTAIADVLGDLAAGRPMDRLVCGDVGFGKTEVALRSAFLSVLSGGQVAVVAPTTLLARQHYRTFSQRFAGLPVRIGQLSRMVSAKEAGQVRQDLASGQLDIVVGTHALLGKQVRFRNLALLIVDEEQHFGVKHKERLKQLKSDVHVLTLTATPIPRTLQMAFAGVKELSLIATPPVDRLAVRTFVLPFDPVVVREALLRERYRGGQSFYVCPRIEDLPEAAAFLKEHVPEVKFQSAHGRLAATDLEAVMAAFYEGQFDVLVSTNIVESGLDIPAANTLVVHRADMFGLAQLYQLRGRIGRSKLRAYAYFTLPPKRVPTANAEKRLKVLQALDQLGAGFSLASHDLDIRGAGNLLGEEQSGHIREVGLELYQQMLEEAVTTARSGGVAQADAWSPQINLGTAVLIPEAYVADLDVRLGLYRRLAELASRREIDGFAAELVDRFGPLPEEVRHLLEVVDIKRLCLAANVEKLEAGPRGATLAFHGNSYPNPAGLVGFISKQAGTAKLRPDHRLVFLRNWPDEEARLKGALALVGQLAKLAQVESDSSAA